ncbi:unnamed protein product [Rhizophagus irregularis]|nr:unnamed protein product [Rhizophagus irregularis]
MDNMKHLGKDNEKKQGWLSEANTWSCESNRIIVKQEGVIKNQERIIVLTNIDQKVQLKKGRLAINKRLTFNEMEECLGRCIRNHQPACLLRSLKYQKIGKLIGYLKDQKSMEQIVEQSIE